MIGGSIIGSIYTILPIFLVRVESTHNMIYVLMMTTILGGILLKVPMGKLSDIIDRRKVILLTAIGIVVTSVCAFMFYKSYVMFSMIIFLLGVCAFVIYPLAISHASDFLEGH